MTRLLPALKALVWTVLLAAAIATVDRLLVGPPTPQGWVPVSSVEAIPDAAGPVLLPSYLPDTLVWPPARVFHRDGEAQGWWLELGPREPGGPILWLGSGAAPAPQELGEAARCLPNATESGCPPPWHELSKKIDGRTVWVLSTIEPKQLARVFAGLRPR